MQLRVYDPRIIAIDLRFRRSGFAIFEGPKRLLDFGTVAISPGNVGSARNRFSELFKLSLPVVILLKKQRWENLLTYPEAKPLIEALISGSESHRIQIRLLDQEAIDATYRNLGCETKADISSALARIFPELVWQLPPRRKAWEPEHWRQKVFDAISLGLAYWQHETSAIENLQWRMEFPEKDT